MATPNIKKTYHKSKKVSGYTYMQICGDLCGGTCCNHGTISNACFKKITDKLSTEYKTLDKRKKQKSLIRIPVLKWIVKTDSLEIITLNKLANTCIGKILKEQDKSRIEKLQQDLDNINQKLIEQSDDEEIFAPITNQELIFLPKRVLNNNYNNICMYKDHKKTNLCTIHDGIKEEGTDNVIARPTPCTNIGSEKYPCPWHHPERYGEIFNKMKKLLERTGHKGLTKNTVHKYLSQQYNLNKTFEEKILQPYLKSVDTEI